MTEYVVKIEGRFHPEPIKEYEAFSVNLTSFSVRVEKDALEALPHTNIQLKGREARERLQQEILPLLSVFGSEEGQSVTLEVTNIIGPTLLELSSELLVTYTISGPALTAEEMRQRVFWATADPTYRDLLDFYTEAQVASNPRPAGYKMVERLETKYGNRAAVLTALGLVKSDLHPVVANQSEYQGDRHAEYEVGKAPEQLDSAKRLEVLRALKHIIHEYEMRVCSTAMTW